MLSKVLPDIGITDSGVRDYPATDQKSISGIEAVESEQSGHSHSHSQPYYHYIQIWEVQTGRCLKTFEVGGVVKCVAWCPNTALSLVAVAVDTKVTIYRIVVDKFLLYILDLECKL